jgi:hypothetical protein
MEPRTIGTVTTAAGDLLSVSRKGPGRAVLMVNVRGTEGGLILAAHVTLSKHEALDLALALLTRANEEG